MPENIAAIIAARKATKKTTRRVKNLVCRGGTWYVRKKLESGQVVRVSTKLKDKTLAEVKAREILGRIDKGEVDEFIGVKKATEPAPTYGTFGDRYLKTVSALKKRPRVDREFLSPSITAWRDRRLDKITPMDCMTLLAELKLEGRAENSRLCIMTLSSCLFNRAVAEEIVTKNPWHKVPRQSKPKRVARTRVISHAEEPDFIAAIRREDVRRLTRLMIAAGLRIGEALAVEPKRHLDFANKMFRLTGDMTKNGEARTIPMFPETESALLEQLANNGDQLDSTKPTFRSVTTRRANKVFKKVSDVLKLEHGITPHDCRRTFGTRMAIEENVPMATLKEWMGHSSIEITAEFYTHQDEAASQAIAQRISAGRRGKVVSISKAK